MEQLNLILTLNKNGSITANWSRISTAVKYSALMYQVGESYAIYNAKNLTSTSYTSKAQLTANKQYKVTVSAFNSSGMNITSMAKQILIPSDFYKDMPLAVPQNVNATADTVSVTVRYDGVDRATGYDILFDNAVYHTSGTSKTFPGLTPKTSHTYAVRAKNSTQTGSYSATKTIMTLPVTPAVPSGIQKTVTETSATISWSAVSGATGYDLQFNGTTYSVSGTSRTFTGLAAARSYSFQLRAKNADVSSAYTASMTVTTAPRPPVTVTATSTATSLTVNWSAAAGATGYILHWNNNYLHMRGTDYTATLTGLTPKTSYTYQVCSKGPDGSGTYSASKTIMTLAQPPKAPEGTAAATDESSVTVSWGPVSGATGYDVLFNGAVYSVTGTSKTFGGLTADTGYTWQVRSKNADGVGEYSASQTVRTTPKAPSGSATSSATSESSVTISWGAVSGATGYDILIDGKVYEVTGTSKTITGLKPNTAYSYQIRVKNANGKSSYGAAKTVKTTPAAPVSSSGSVSKDAVTISWNAAPGATGYDILFNGVVYPVTGTSWTFTGLNPGTGYTWQVRSKNADGFSSYSAAQTVTTIPASPANVNATATVNSVTVTWNAVNGATSYDILFDGAVSKVTGTSRTFTGLKPNTSHTYRVRANGAGGTGAYSASKTIKTPEAPPAVPANVNASVESNMVFVTWSAVSGASSYDVLFNGTVYNVKPYTFRTFTDLAWNTSYTYAVRARNSGGVSAYSALKTIRTPIAPPAVPMNVNAVATKNTVTVTWNAVGGATGYNVKFGGTSYDVTGTSLTINGLTPDSNYTYAVRAKNAGGYGIFSEAKTIRTLPDLPAIPTDLTAFADAHAIIVGWIAADKATGYELLFNGKVYTSSGTQITVDNLAANTDYSFKVRAVNSYGCSDYTAERTVRTLLDVPSNIHAEPEMFSMKVYWDPVDGATGYDIGFEGMEYHVTDTFIEFTGLKPETSYAFSVCARNEAVISKYSKVLHIKTRRAVPEIPTNLKTSSTMTTVTVSWDPSENADSYGISLDGVDYPVEAASTAAVFRSRGKNRLHKIFFDLTPNTLYTVSVRAENEYGSSDYGMAQFVKTKNSNRNGLPGFGPDRRYPDGRIPHMGMDPVNALTGAFLWSYTLLEDYGKDALHFTVMYDSKREAHPKALGRGWTYSLNYLLSMDSEYVYFSTPWDEVTAFLREEDGSFSPAEQTEYTMGRKEDGSWFVKSADGTEYVFDGGLVLNRIEENGLVTCRFHADKDGQITRIDGRYGAFVTLAWTDGHISHAEDSMGNTVSLLYSGELLSAIVNRDGNGMRFTYDAAGRLMQISDFIGKAYLTNTYDDYGRILSQNTAGRGDSYASYEEGVTAFTDERGDTTVYRYDDKLRVTGVERAGNGITNGYNEDGQLSEQTDGLGRVTRMAYDTCGRMNCVTYPDGTEEKTFYNDRNNPVRLVNRDGTETRYEYDDRNNLISVQDERGNISSYVYNENDELISYTDKSGQVWTYAYDAGHHIKQATDPEGNVFLYSHDALGRLLSHTSPTGKTTTCEYSPSGSLLRITDADGTVAFEYDKNGSRTGITDRMGHRQQVEYNEMGQISLATDFLGNAWHFEYDAAGNLIKETDPLGYSKSYAYDANGNCTAFTDANGGAARCSFDAADQLTQVRDAAGGLISYAYDTMGQIVTVTDALDHATNYAYDAAGRLLCVTGALGDSISYTYDAAGNLLTKTDENGAVIKYTYDRENRPVSITSDAGTVLLTYDRLGRVIAVEDADGFAETAQYDGDGNLITFLNKENSRTAYVYDLAGRLAEETAPNGGKTTYAYDKNGNCTEITDAEGNTRSYAYDAAGQIVKETDPLGNSTSYVYNARGELIQVTDPRGGITTYAYDGNGNRVQETNPSGGRTVFTYDSLNRLTKITDAEGNISSFTYDAAGNRTSFTDAEQNTWSFEYDALNRLTAIKNQEEGCLTYAYTKTGKIEKVTDQEGAQTGYRYDTLGRLLEMSDALGHSLRFTYDRQGRVLTQTDANGNVTEYTYSPSGNLLGVKTPEGGAVSFTYNALGQKLTETDPLGNVTSYAYDALGRVLSVTDALGAKTVFTYTADGRIDTVTDAAGGVTAYRYDAGGNLTQVTDPMGNVTVYEYDAMNHQIREYLAAGEEAACVTLWQYDKNGRMIREINPISEEKVYTYDRNGNPVSIQDEDGGKTVVRYDLNSRPVGLSYSDGKEASFRYNKRGELVELKDWNGTAVMEYDRAGKLTGVTDHNGHTIAYGYDAAGNLTDIVYPDGGRILRGYDGNNRLTKVTDAEGQITQYAYDAAGNILSIRQPGGHCAFTYDGRGLPVKAHYQFDDGTTEEQSFTYDLCGRIRNVERTGGTPELSGSASFSYDPVGRLLSRREGPLTEDFDYDALGNRTVKKINGAEQTACRYNALNQLIARTENGKEYLYGYDKRGNLTEEKLGDRLIRQYLYDAAGHMRLGKNLETGEQTEYGYNALSMRVFHKQTLRNPADGGSGHTGTEDASPAFRAREIQYVPDFLSGTNNELMAYETGFGSTRTVFGHGYERLSQKVTLQPDTPQTPRAAIASLNAGKTFFQSDLYGSPLFASTEQGDVRRYAKRNVWGQPAIPLPEDLDGAGLEESLRFTNYCYDPVIGKYFAQARFYDACQGRMLSMDPVRRSLNAYPYCGSDPVNYVDPTGEIANILAGGIIGGLVGGAFGFAGSAASQLLNREKFSARKALGAAANGAVTGAVRGAMVGTGIGAIGAFAGNFAAGAVGSALEQHISTGHVSIGDSMVGGLTNAVSGAIYGTGSLKGAGSAFLRGAGAGAATAGINSLYNSWKNRGSGSFGAARSEVYRLTGLGGFGENSLYGAWSDPRSGCGSPDSFRGVAGYRMARGYRYTSSRTRRITVKRKSSFSLGGFLKDTLLGAAFGGMASLTFYGAGKAVESLRSSIGGNKGGSSEYDLYRKTSNTGAFKNLEEPMQLRNAKNVANEAGVGLNGIKLKIDRNPEMLGRNVYGYTDGKAITLYPDAFTNTETLVKTLGHERMHVYQVGVYGKPTSTDVLGAFERGASMSEQSWWDYFNFKNGGI